MEEGKRRRMKETVRLPDYLFFPINTDLVARFTSENVSSFARLAAPKLLKS